MFSTSVSAALAKTRFSQPIHTNRNTEVTETPTETDDDVTIDERPRSRVISARLQRMVRTMDAGMPADHLIEKLHNIHTTVSRRWRERELQRLVEEHCFAFSGNPDEINDNENLQQRVKTFLDSLPNDGFEARNFALTTELEVGSKNDQQPQLELLDNVLNRTSESTW